MTGRGGMLADPAQDRLPTRFGTDFRSFPPAPTAKAVHPPPSAPSLVEASAYHHNSQTGTVELIGDPASQLASTSASSCPTIAPAS